MKLPQMKGDKNMTDKYLLISYLIKNKNAIIHQTAEMLDEDNSIITLMNSDAYEKLKTELTETQKESVVQIVAERMNSFFQDLMMLFDNDTEFSDTFMLDILNEDKKKSINAHTEETYLDVYFDLEFNKDD